MYVEKTTSLKNIAKAHNDYINALTKELMRMDAVTMLEFLEEYKPISTAARKQMVAISKLLTQNDVEHKIDYSTLLIDIK